MDLVVKTKKAIAKTAVIAAIVIVIVAALLGSYWYLYIRAPPTPTPTPTPTPPEKIKIGAVLAFTGPAAVWGAEKKVAMDILVEWINAEGGIYIKEYGKKIPIELIAEDEAGVAEKALAATKKLILMDKVVAISGFGHSHCALAALPDIEAAGIPVTMHEVWSDLLTAKSVKNVFRVGSGCVSVVGEIYADFAKEYGFKRPAVMGEDTDFGVEGVRISLSYYRARNITAYSSFIVSQFAKEYYPELTSIKAAGCDLLELWIFGRGLYTLTIQGSEIGLFHKQSLVVWCDPGPILPEYWPSMGDMGVYVCFNYNWHNKTFPLTVKLRDEFKKRTGREATYMTHVAFDSFYTLIKGIEAAGTLKSDAIVAALEKIDLQVTSGYVRFPDPATTKGTWRYHHYNAPNVIWQWKNRTHYVPVYPAPYKVEGIARPP